MPFCTATGAAESREKRITGGAGLALLDALGVVPGGPWQASHCSCPLPNGLRASAGWPCLPWKTASVTSSSWQPRQVSAPFLLYSAAGAVAAGGAAAGSASASAAPARPPGRARAPARARRARAGGKRAGVECFMSASVVLELGDAVHFLDVGVPARAVAGARSPRAVLLGVRLFAVLHGGDRTARCGRIMWLRAASLVWHVEQTAVAGVVATSPSGRRAIRARGGAASIVVASAIVESGG